MTNGNIDKAFRYDQKTGDIFWLINPSCAIKAGFKAGSKDKKSGYMRIKYKYKRFLCHRLAWRLHYGEWPSGPLDHINGIKTDNRIENLRITDARQNGCNRWTHRAGRLPGSSYSAIDRRWRSYININGKKRQLSLNNK